MVNRASNAGYTVADSAVQSIKDSLERRQTVGADWAQAAQAIAQSQSQYRDALDRSQTYESEGKVMLGEQEVGRAMNRVVVGGMLRAGLNGGRNAVYA